jgi:hypothetical protein
MAEQGSGGGNSVNMVAIIAMIVLVGIAAWFFLGQSRKTTTSAPAGKTETTEKKSDVQVEIDLPDSVTIKP